MPPNVAPPNGRPANPIAPPVFAVTGNARADSVLATLDVTIAPFRQAPPPEQGAAGYVAQGLGGVLGVINAPMMFIDAAASQGISAILDATGLSALFPALPVATIGLSMHLGTPHTHVHPPSLIPPAPPIPLPSLGIAFLAGSASVLVGGVPALRAGDIGLGITCGSLAPPFEIMTGASGVYFAGARVARFGMDITFHCNPVSPMGAFAIGMGVAGIVAGAAGAAAQAASGNSGAAIAQGIQAGLDAAAMAVSMLRGKDPAGPPGVGVLLGPPMGNVMAGGPPIPNIGALAQGKLFSALGRALRSMRGRLRRRTPAPDANGRACEGGEPVNVVTGANFNTHVDFASLLGAFTWARYTSSADHATRGVLGFGWRHAFESSLSIQLHRVTFAGWQGEQIVFPRLRGTDEVVMHGYRLRRLENHRFAVSHPRLGTLMFQQDGPGSGVARLIGVRQAKHVIELRYDAHRRLVEIVERAAAAVAVAAAVATYALRYDDAGHLAEVWGSRFGEPSARLVRYRHDLAGDLLGADDIAGKSDAYAYDRTHRIVRATDRIAYSFTWTYDMEGRCTETQGTDGLWFAAFEYLPDKQTTKMTIHDGSVYTFVYDEDGVITKVVGPCGDSKKRVRALDGTVLAEIDAGGHRIDFVYDADGALVARRGQFGHMFPPSLVASGIPQMLGRRLPKDTRGFYFGGALARTTLPPPTPEQRRDHLGKVIFARDAEGHEEKWAYDAVGNEVAHIDRDGRMHRREVVRWGLLGARIDPAGNKVRYEYNPHQRITRVVDGGGSESKYVYDSHDRVIEVHRQGALRERYVWDGHRLVEKQDPDGTALLRITPHANGLAGTIERADGSTLELDYDRNGKVTKAHSSAHRVQRSFTVFEEVALEDCDGRTVRHDYGWHGEITTTIAEKFIAARHRHGSTIVLVDPTGRRRVIKPAVDGSVSIDHGNGTHEVQQFDTAGRIVGRTCARPDDRVGRGLRWNVRHQYTPAGDLVATTDSIRGTVRYGLDEAHRLVRSQQDGGSPVTYRHDAANNLVELPAVGVVELAPGNRLRTAATEQFHYDPRGRLARRVGAGGSETQFHYDAEDQLVRVEDGGVAWTATYDALGRRVTFGRGDRRTRLWWDGDRIAARETPDGGFRIYLYVDRESLIPIGIVDWNSIDAPIESGRSYAVFCDQVGLPQHIEDERGEIVWWADQATPYGEVFVQPGNAFEYNLRFVGHLYDPDLRLHYNRFRDYDPALGRYLQPDPIGVRGGVNLYAYASNPLVAVDVLGLTKHDNPENGPPRSEEGETRPADENPNPTADAPPARISREEAVALAHERANAHLEKINRPGALDGQGFKEGEFPACSAAVVDRTNPDATFARHNQPGTAKADPAEFHPLLRQRVIDQQGRRTEGLDHFSQPATHAEVLALNDALMARDPGPNHRLTDPAVLDDFVQTPVWNREMKRSRAGLERPAGSIAGCCGHCARVTDGVHNPVAAPGPIHKADWSIK